MDVSGKRILVIGGAGFIGSHVVDQLLMEDVQEVIVFDNLIRGSLDNLKIAMEDKRCVVLPCDTSDILNRDSLEAAMSGIDGVFHLAALWLLHCNEYPEQAFEANVKGTFNVIQSAVKCKVKKIVFSSSASVYGDGVRLPIDELHPYNNNTFYGATKIACEHMLKSLGYQHNLDWVALRYMNVYGERQDYRGAYTAVIHKMLDKIELGQDIEVHGDGNQIFDFIEVSDVARANLCAMKSLQKNEFYNIGRGIGTSLKELAELLIILTGSPCQISYKKNTQTLVTKRIGDSSKAEREINFKWSVGLRDGLVNLIKYRNIS